MYLMNTRPYICFFVNTLSQYLVEPKCVHLIAAKHVMRYLKGTLDFGLCYIGDHDFRLVGYTNSDWDGSVSDRKRCGMRLKMPITFEIIRISNKNSLLTFRLQFFHSLIINVSP
jgi:hypothetical protein